MEWVAQLKKIDQYPATASLYQNRLLSSHADVVEDLHETDLKIVPKCFLNGMNFDCKDDIHFGSNADIKRSETLHFRYPQFAGNELDSLNHHFPFNSD